MKFLDFLRRVIATGYDEGRNEDQPLNMRSTHVERIATDALNELKSGSVAIDETQWDNAKLKAENAELQARLKAADARVEAATSAVPGLAESGPYTLADVVAIEQHRGKPYARLRETVTEHDAAKRVIDELEADAARLRGDLLRIDTISMSSFEGATMLQSMLTQAGEVARAALAVPDSADWLAKHDAEVRAPLRAQVETLTQQLAAATNDAARAELRALDLTAALRPHVVDEGLHRTDCIDLQIYYGKGGFGPVPSRCGRCGDCLARAALAAAPDSDARLREVMETMWHMGATAGERGTLAKEDIDEVLGVKSKG